MNSYSHKPENVSTLPNLIAFVQGIPDEEWIINQLEDELQRRCVAGHVNAAFNNGEFFSQRILPPEVDPHILVGVNNGDHNNGATYNSGHFVKARVLEYLNKLAVAAA